MATIPQGANRHLKAVTGGAVGRRLARCASYLAPIDACEETLKALSDYDLRKESLSLRYRARSGEPLDKLLVEAFALVREAGRRKLGMRHFDVQLLGGAAAHHGSIIEMQTGEGKTLTASLPMYLAALDGKGAHLSTVNDYLAKRDADIIRPLYEALGMTVGVIQSQMPQPKRREAYACDVTYGTANEMGFDFLRDRLLKRQISEGARDLFGEMLSGGGASGDKPVQGDLHYMLVDEADSILIDEARTPLIISAAPGEDEVIASEAYQWAAEVQPKFEEDVHFEYDHKDRRADLTVEGRRLVREMPKPAAMNRLPLSEIYEYIERATKVEQEMILDRHYVVREGEIVIVDEFTGRLAEGRKWRAGLHQAIEAREGVEITFETNQAARITIQDLFLRYRRLSGMTGTGVTSGAELRKIYETLVVPIPTNRPPIRKQLPTQVFGSSDQKWDAIVEEIREVHATGRPVLVGTRSIDKSESLARLLEAGGIETTVLNARHVEREAEIVAEAGQRGRVTVATNMAGRGTDIKLGDGVHDLGGLHVICTELHESRRIDRQLIGRCGRQGDPGSYRQFLALDDDILLQGFGEKRSKRLKSRGEKAVGPGAAPESLFTRAQQKVERRHFRERKVLLYQDKERQKMQRQMSQDPYLDTAG
ncbi:preprotein translocase subunit SecA [Pseudobythopirellula maris]|uniref:Protein translocase subunit SecA n=1 Tax=Pseudobythopirellula maris TaxID=2527991 RepID=A0A5C5ZST0_9BACT|nr:preprotein translocase subunit SecA [Pseudobythopirellula maris]TWT90047.1 preprotein translocase subunit SecA [Pseudobythopirellula maris]